MATYTSQAFSDTPELKSIDLNTDQIEPKLDVLHVDLQAATASLGTDMTTPTPMPAGGTGIRGWLSAIWTKLNSSLAITATALPLPTGAATETTSAALNAKVTTSANGVKVDGSAVTQPVSATALPLPTGAATETTLAALNGKLGTPGQKVMAASTPVVLASDQTLPLPTGAATETTSAALNAKVTTSANGVKVDGSAVTQPVSATALPLPTGAATETTVSSLNTNLVALLGRFGSLGQKVMSGSAPVTIASNQSPLPIAPGLSSLTHTAGVIATANVSQLALAANAARQYLLIQNNSNTIMFVRMDGVAPTVTTGMLLAANGGSWESPPHFCPVGAINVLCSVAAKSFIIVTN